MANTLSGDATSSSKSMKVELFWVHCGITKNRPSIILRLSGNETNQAHRRRTCMDLFLHSAEYEERPSRFMTKLPFHRSHLSISQAQTHDAASTSPLLVSTKRIARFFSLDYCDRYFSFAKSKIKNEVATRCEFGQLSSTSVVASFLSKKFPLMASSLI